MTIIDEPTTDTEPAYKWVGTRPIRPDGLDKVTGRARFGADLSLPGMLEGAILRSPHAHAKIMSIDTTAARAMPGVKAIITGADFPDLSASGASDDDVSLSCNVIARDKVLYEGHVVAAVAAGTRQQAQAAAAEIVVGYERLPHVMNIDDAMAADAPLLHETQITRGVEPAPTSPSNVSSRVFFERGNLDEGFAAADTVVERTFTTKPVHQGYIEPHAAVADVGENGHTELWCSSQGHFAMRSQTAAVLGWEMAKVKVTPAEIGGGFGGKTRVYLEPLATLLSKKAGRPVRLAMSRAEVFQASGPSAAGKIRVKMGISSDGAITACDAWMAYEAGAFPGNSKVNLGAMTALAPYNVPHFFIEGFDVVCNKPQTGAYRAPGAPIAAFAFESVIDELAMAIGMDPLELRVKNAAVEGTDAPYGPKFPRIGFVETLDAIRTHDHYQAPLGPNQGRGVASGFWFNAGGNASATVNANEDGSLTVITGMPDIGGNRSSMALFAAEELGVDVTNIRAIIADTESIGFNDMTGGSRATMASGGAVIEACTAMRSDLCRRAAKMWDVDIAEVEWVDGQAQHNAGNEPPLALATIAQKSSRTGGPISQTATVNMRGAGASFSTQVVDVEVDPETGQVAIVRFTTAQDAGRAIHPSYVEGQMQGSVAQGIGWALNEEYIYNDDGTLANPSFLDYRVPVASDLPMIDTVIVEVPNPAHPYGVRGVGESGMVPTLPAIANAVADAIKYRMTDLPMSPVRVLSALNERDA